MNVQGSDKGPSIREAVMTAMGRPRGRIIGILVILALLIGVAGVAWLRSEKSPQYRTAPVERGEIVATISASGTLNAVITVQVGSQVSGRIKNLYADFNSRVVKGQLIARIDPDTFEAKVNQAKADVDNARVAVKDAKIKRDSRAALFQEGGIAQEERDSAQASYDSAAAKLEASLAALRAAQVDLDRTHIYAPVNGVVIARNVDVGQTVAASLQAPTLFLIAEDLHEMQVDTNVDEADISRIQVGQQTTFTVDAFPGEEFKGQVVQIRQAPIVQQNVVTYIVVVAVVNPDLKLKPGLTANVRVLVDRRADALKIPNAALRFKPPSPDGGPLAAQEKARGSSQIWILDDGRLSGVAVELGLSDEYFTEVLEGDVKEGQAVVVGSGTRDASRRPQQRRRGLGF
ncbi:MAG: efflux RND transporter periplasmic adaptor subunit [candidate division NC10 bacterium]|nr:efflux RND transporter periplasmic adaptor subunit [candidate division NC10 bacterium]